MGVDGATEFQGAKWCPVPYVVSVRGRLNPRPLAPPCSLTSEQRRTDAGPGGLRAGCPPPGELPRKSTGARAAAADRPRQRPPLGRKGGGSLACWFFLSKAVPGATVHAPIPLDRPLAWLRPQGGEPPTEVNTAWCRGRHANTGGRGCVLGRCHYLLPELLSSPLSLRFPAVKPGGKSLDW